MLESLMRLKNITHTHTPMIILANKVMASDKLAQKYHMVRKFLS